MAMKPCRECGVSIGETADPCPSCGTKMPHGPQPWRYVVFVCGMILLFSWAAGNDGCVARAHAEPPRWENEVNAGACAESYPERIADVRRARAEHAAYMAEHKRLAVWFNEHCRFLSELEIAIRKLDDELSFVCDTQKGRPKGLTGAAVAPYLVPTTIVIHMEWSHSDVVCEPHDVSAGRPSLNLHEPVSDDKREAAAYTVRLLEALCWQIEGKECDAARAAIAALRAKPAATP